MGELYNPYPKLPKNIRQIGEREQVVRLYIEDYVNTYLKRLFPITTEEMKVGLLLGSMEIHEATPYIFIDGAIEMEGVVKEGETVAFSEEGWKAAYQCVEEMFPKRKILGWFVCGNSVTQLSPLNYWKQHVEYFQGQHKLMYLSSGQDGEEALYITSEDGFYKLRGHSIYYERNQLMQDYMILRKGIKRTETGVSDTVIREFRQRLDDKKVAVKDHRQSMGLLGGICSVLSIVVLAGGIVMLNNYEKMKSMESVIASVLPVEQKKEDESGIIIEEVAGEIVSLEQTTPALETSREVVAQPIPEVTQPVTTPETTVEETSAQKVQESVIESTAKETVSSEVIISEAQTIEAIPIEESKKPAETKKSPSVSEKMEEVDGKVYRTYVVGDGDTLYGICLKMYGNLNKVEEICQINKLEDENRISSGQKLLIP